MTNKKKIILAAVVFLAALLFVFSQTQKGVNIGAAGFSDSRYTVIDSNDASSTAAVTVNSVPGVLTSVTVGTQSSTTATTRLGLYDSSSGTSSASLIGTLESGVAVGTYTFNVETTSGLTLDVPAAFDGVYTVSYK